MNYSFQVQFCWKEPEKIHGFFKVRPSYYYDGPNKLLTKPAPMVITENITLDFSEENRQRIVRGLMNIMEHI